jgi:hypothetical protein
MSSLRFLEIGMGLIMAALLNFLFGYWINIVLMLVGGLCMLIAFIEKSTQSRGA